MQLIRTFLSLAVATLLAASAAFAQSGYSIQLSAYSSPATLKFFEALRQPVQQVKIDDKTYLYVIDGFVSYADADKVRKMAVGKGFPDAIALKTSSSRNPALKVKPYTGPTDGAPVPDAAGAAPAQATASTPQATPPATPPSSGKPTPPATTTPPATQPTTYTSTATPANQPTQTYNSGGARPATPQAQPAQQQPYSSNTPAPGTTKPGATPAQQPASPTTTAPGKQPSASPAAPTVTSTTPAPGKSNGRTPAKPAEDPYGNNGKVYTYDIDPNVSATARGNTNISGEPAASSGSYDQNFPISENTVRALVSKGSVPQAKVSNDLPQSTGVVFFDYNKAMLRSSAEQEMARLATKLMNNIGYSLEIRAHTDAIGPDGYNDELSERRGKSAMIYMLRKGVPASRVSFRAFGESRPLADNTTPDGGDNPMGRQINRRVELVVKDAYGAVVETVTLP